MQQDSTDTQLIELTKEIPALAGVRFDPTRVCLTGTYSDELSLFRAKRTWTKTLEDNFLLEKEYDYEFSYHGDPDSGSFILNCEFVTACGRYAFWRLTNNQAPEAQYLIETAHIPNAESHHQDFLQAPDLESVDEEPAIERMPGLPRENTSTYTGLKSTLTAKARAFFHNIFRR